VARLELRANDDFGDDLSPDGEQHPHIRWAKRRTGISIARTLTTVYVAK
jgi:hypothetical protein